MRSVLLTPAWLADMRAQRIAQGLPEHIEDPVGVTRIATVVRRHLVDHVAADAQPARRHRRKAA